MKAPVHPEVKAITYSGCFSANASRSASGSFAKITVLWFSLAVRIARS